MRTLGVWIVVLTVASYVLPKVGMQLVVLLWIYSWGPTVAMLIQSGLLALGVGLIVGGTLLARGRSHRGGEASNAG